MPRGGARAGAGRPRGPNYRLRAKGLVGIGRGGARIGAGRPVGSKRGQQVLPFSKTCQVCSGPLVNAANARKFCSPKCFKRSEAARVKAYAERRRALCVVSHVCLRCGAAFHGRKKKFCSSNCRYKRPCANCGKVFSIASGRRTCSPECASARWMENILRMRLDEMAKTQRLRESRRKASERRRARGWKSEKGRWLRICERDGFTCWICRQPINPDIQLNRPMS